MNARNLFWAVLCLSVSLPVFSQADKKLAKRIASIHKDEIKCMKKTEGFSSINVKAYADGYWYYQVGRKGEGGRLVGAVDSAWRQLVPIEYKEIAYHPPVAEGTTPMPRYYELLRKAYPPYSLYHRAQPGALVGTAPGKVAVYSTGGKLHHEYAADRYDYLPGYIVVQAQDIDRNCYHSTIFEIEEGKAILEQGGRELATDFETFRFSSLRNVCEYTRNIGGVKKEGLLSVTDTTLNIPCLFYLIGKDEAGNYEVMRTEASNWEAFDPARHSSLAYIDKGEELFDQGRYADVVAYYRQPGNECEYGTYLSGAAMYEMAHDEVWRIPSFCSDVKKGVFFVAPGSYEDETFNVDSAAALAQGSCDLLRKYLELDTAYAEKASRYMEKAENLLGKLPRMREQLASAYSTIDAYISQQKAEMASAVVGILAGAVSKAISKPSSSGGGSVKPVAAANSSATRSAVGQNESSNDGSGSAETRKKVKCRACGGTGIWVNERISGEEKWCDRCGKARKPHTHKTCGSCDGKGWHY